MQSLLISEKKQNYHNYNIYLILIISLISIFALSCATRHLTPVPVSYTPSAWDGGALVTTKYGAIRGYADKENTYAWKGIPYALPPVGALRWKAPQEHTPWKGILEGNSFGSQGPQFMPLFGFVTGSEDCLFLNVWRPRSAEKELPVYVWIHGGGNSLGSANFVPDYYGHAKAGKSDMVFVSINYRLGIFGWFYCPGLQTDCTPEEASGNFATLDILAALRWVKENIHVFGGNPENVTVAGESAGAANILSLLTSPLATGLFHKAIIESGYTGNTTPEKATAFSRNFIAKLLVSGNKAKNIPDALTLADTMPAVELRTFLYSRSGIQLMHELKSGSTGMSDVPAIITDGYVFPAGGYAVFKTGAYPVKVPIVIGTNKEETKLFLSFDKTIKWNSALYQAVGKYGGLRWKVDGADGIAGALAAHSDQPPVYVYRFDWGAPNAAGESPYPGNWGKKLGAFHSLEVPFFLGTDTILGIYMTGNLFTKKNAPARRQLTAAIREYLTSFSYTGNPDALRSIADAALQLPAWRPWDPAGAEYSCLVFDTRGDELAIGFLEGLLTTETVDAEMYRELKEPLLSAVVKRLEARH